MMDMDIIAPMVVAIVLIVSVTGAFVLRPLSRHLASLLEAMARERRSENPRIAEQMGQIRDLMQTQAERMALMEERLEFTESIMRRQASRELPSRGVEPTLLGGGSPEAGAD
jgi:hypothetical protein